MAEKLIKILFTNGSSVTFHKGGETIMGNLCRLETGEFGSCDGSQGAVAPGQEDKVKAAEEAAAGGEEVAPAEVDAAATAAGLDPRDAAALADPAQLANLSVEDSERLSAAGLVVRNEDGSYSPSELGQAVGEAVAAGDAEAAAESVEEAAEAFQAEQGKEDGPTPKEEEASATQTGTPSNTAGGAETGEASGGSGGGGQGFRPPSQEQMMQTINDIPPEQRDENWAKINEKLKLPPGFVAGVDEVKDPSEGIKMNPEFSAKAQELGLVVVGEGGTEQLTDAGRLFVTAAAAGDASSAAMAVEEGSKQVPVVKRGIDDVFHHFVKFAGILNEEQRLIEGYASTDGLDDQGDIVDEIAIKEALPDFMQWGNLREMHEAKAAGTVVRAEVRKNVRTPDGQVLKYALYIVAKVVDDEAWKKVKEGVYKGFSIGGKILRAVRDKMADGTAVRRLTKLLLQEISLVDRPANPHAKILMWKGSGMDPEVELGSGEGEEIAKAADPKKIITQIQVLRNEAESNGEASTASKLTEAIQLVMQATGEAVEGEEPVEEVAEGEVEVAEGDVAEMMAAASKITSLAKAGRTFSTKNAAAMHSLVKMLAEMLAGSGDEVAQKVLAAYGSPEDTDKASLVKGNTDLAEALSGALAPFMAVVSETFTKMGGRVEELEAALSRMPRNGGPILRIAKGSELLGGEPEADPVAARMAELQKSLETETHPFRKRQIREELTKLEIRKSLNFHS